MGPMGPILKQDMLLVSAAILTLVEQRKVQHKFAIQVKENR